MQFPNGKNKLITLEDTVNKTEKDINELRKLLADNLPLLQLVGRAQKIELQLAQNETILAKAKQLLEIQTAAAQDALSKKSKLNFIT